MLNKNVCIIKDKNTNWWKKFHEILIKKNISHRLVEVEKNDWLEQIHNIDYIIWRPNLSEPYLRQSYEKLYFIENVLRKKVYPNQQSFWHYNNKNAQKYLKKIICLDMPNNFVSYSYSDSLNFLKNCKYPIVSKSAGGAGSKNVRLLKNFKYAKQELDYIFNKNLKNRFVMKFLGYMGLRQTKYDFQKYYVNYQEFIPKNSRDLRITTIGKKFAFAFFRENRENDFRASGSGKIIYNRDNHNLEIIKYFLNFSEKNNFDTMCYDILFNESGYLTIEFSYIFVDKAIYNSQGYYELIDGHLNFIKKHVWPQELIIEYLLEKWEYKKDIFFD